MQTRRPIRPRDHPLHDPVESCTVPRLLSGFDEPWNSHGDHRRRSEPASRRPACSPSSFPGTSPSSWTATADGPQRRGLPRIMGHRRGIQSVRAGGRGGVPARARSVDALLPLGRELEAAAARADVPDAAAAAFPGRRAQRADGAERPAHDDRPARRPAARRARRVRAHGRADRLERRDDPLPGGQLRRPDRDRRRGTAARRGRAGRAGRSRTRSTRRCSPRICTRPG